MVAMTLLQRVVAGNALVVFVGAMILALSPATISPRITASEAGLLAAGIALALVANVLLMRRALAPLRALAAEMATVDLLRPAPPHGPRTGVLEVAMLGRAYDAMLERLIAERRDSAPPGDRRPGGRARADRARAARRGRPDADRRRAGAAGRRGARRRRARDERRRGAGGADAPASTTCARSRAGCGPRRWRTSACAARWSRSPRRWPTARGCACAASWRRACRRWRPSASWWSTASRRRR